jgi:hypothetical protein
VMQYKLLSAVQVSQLHPQDCLLEAPVVPHPMPTTWRAWQLLRQGQVQGQGQGRYQKAVPLAVPLHRLWMYCKARPQYGLHMGRSLHSRDEYLGPSCLAATAAFVPPNHPHSKRPPVASNVIQYRLQYRGLFQPPRLPNNPSLSPSSLFQAPMLRLHGFHPTCSLSHPQPPLVPHP